jgi:hypothetical protein
MVILQHTGVAIAAAVGTAAGPHIEAAAAAAAPAVARSCLLGLSKLLGHCVEG